MAKGITIKVEGLRRAKQMIENSSKKATLQMTKSLARAAIFVQGEVKMSIAGRRAEPTSVDTGRFLNSVGISVFGKDAKVFSKLPYAKKLEFGFKGFTGRRHFSNTSKRTKSQVLQIFKRELAKL